MRLFRKIVIRGCEARGDQHSPYLTRYYLMKTKTFEVCLHIFHRSDTDDAMHDHPWDFWTLVLWKGYVEEVTERFGITGLRSIKPLRLYFRRAEHRHRVLLHNGTAVTLNLMFKRRRSWYFYTDEGQVWWRDYVNEKGCVTDGVN